MSAALWPWNSGVGSAAASKPPPSPPRSESPAKFAFWNAKSLLHKTMDIYKGRQRPRQSDAKEYPTKDVISHKLERDHAPLHPFAAAPQGSDHVAWARTQSLWTIRAGNCSGRFPHIGSPRAARANSRRLRHVAIASRASDFVAVRPG